MQQRIYILKSDEEKNDLKNYNKSKKNFFNASQYDCKLLTNDEILPLTILLLWYYLLVKIKVKFMLYPMQRLIIQIIREYLSQVFLVGKKYVFKNFETLK